MKLSEFQKCMIVYFGTCLAAGMASGAIQAAYEIHKENRNDKRAS